jgi:hypothetical protein
MMRRHDSTADSLNAKYGSFQEKRNSNGGTIGTEFFDSRGTRVKETFSVHLPALHQSIRKNMLPKVQKVFE